MDGVYSGYTLKVVTDQCHCKLKTNKKSINSHIGAMANLKEGRGGKRLFLLTELRRSKG